MYCYQHAAGNFASASFTTFAFVTTECNFGQPSRKGRRIVVTEGGMYTLVSEEHPAIKCMPIYVREEEGGGEEREERGEG